MKNDQTGQDNVYQEEEEDNAVRRVAGLFGTNINFTLLRMGIPSSVKLAMIEEAIKKQHILSQKHSNTIEKDPRPNLG